MVAGEEMSTNTMVRDLLYLLQTQPAYRCTHSLLESPISQVTADSRQVRPGALFVAVEGATADGHRYIPDAIARGATAIVGTSDLAAEANAWSIPYIQIEDSRLALATLAAAFYDFPSRRLRLARLICAFGRRNLPKRALMPPGNSSFTTPK